MGVTLIELLFSVALLAALASLAAPGFRSSLRASAVRSASFELLAGLQQARASSILQSRPGLLCPVDSSGNCLPMGTAATGWRSFIEAGSGREALAGQDLPRGLVLRATRSPIRFWPGSFAASTGTLTICDLQRLAPARAIVISQGGRARLTLRAEDECGA